MHGIKPGELYPESVRQFCITVHFHSPAAYKCIRNTFKRKLPHPHTIASWYRYSNVKGSPGIHQETCDRLKRIATDVLEETKQPMICSLIVDEMYIRKQILWCNQSQKYVGYVSYGANQGQKRLPMANQAIVFFLNGINQKLEFPVCFHFIRALNANDKANLYSEVIEKVTECGVVIKNITFDGLASNFAMCQKLGAQLNIFASDFKPFILNPLNQSKIFIMFDNCHAEKLIRNTLGNKGVIYDEKNEGIKWEHLENLLEFSNQFDLRTHKLSKKHIDFKSSIMNVKIATETMSNSVADSLQYLQDKGISKFQKVEPTIRFIRIFNCLFDIFNSRATDSENIFKRPLCADNKAAIYKFLDEAKNYIENLKVDVIIKGKNRKIRVTKSRNGISFRGYIININVIKEMFHELVEEKQYTDAISTYSMSQDFLEIFFGKIRSFHGHNNNPDVICFQSAYQKLCTNILVLPPLKSNCQQIHTRFSTIADYSNIFQVSSLRPKLFTNIEANSEFMENVLKEKQEISTAIFQFEEMDRSFYLTDGFFGASIAYVAQQIEDKIKKNFICNDCKSIFDANEKVFNCFMSSAANSKPCQSTYNICVTTDKFLRCHQWNDQSDFKIKYFLIYQEINFEQLYCATSFEGHEDHKFHLIKSIINEYTRIRGNQLSKRLTTDEMQSILRKRLNKLILSSGQ